MRTARWARATWPAIVLLVVAAAVEVVRWRPVVGILACVGALAVVLVMITPVRFPAALLICATVATRFRVNFLGLGLRVEHFAMLLLVVACVLHARRAVLRRMPSRPELAALAFVAWSAIASLLNSPQPTRSLVIVGWYLIDVIVLWLIVGLIRAGDVTWEYVARVGVWAAAAAGWFAAVLWFLAVAHGGRYGVQTDYASGNLAAFGIAAEGNILGSQSVLWLGVALTLARRSGQRVPMLVLLGLLAGLVTSLARAAWMAAAVMLLLIYVVARRKRRRYDERRRTLGSDASALRALAITASLAAFTIAVVVGGSAIVGKSVVLLQYRQTTGAYRLHSAGNAIDDLRSKGPRAALGLGTNSYGQRHVDETDPKIPGYLGIFPLVVVYDSGLVGVVLAVCLAVGVLRRGRLGPGTHAGILTALLVAATATNPTWFAFVWVVIALLLTASDPPGASNAGGAVGTSSVLPGPAEPALR